MWRRLSFLVAVAVVTIAIALLLIPRDNWTVALAVCLGFILVGEGAIMLAPELLSQPSRGMLPWNVGMSIVPFVYFSVVIGVFAGALGGFQWQVLVSAHLVALLVFGAVITAIRSAGRRVVQTQQADDSEYNEVTRLRTRVGSMLDRLAALSLDDATTIEQEARAFLDRLRYATPTAGADTVAGQSVLLDAVQGMESAVEAMQRGDERQECLSVLRAQIKLADAGLRRTHGTLIRTDS